LYQRKEEPPLINSQPPFVSVIIVNYEGLKWLKLFMAQLINTSYPHFEVIVVDNGSRDGSVEYLQDRFKQVRVIGLSENKGYAHGTNVGVKEATGDVLAFLNNDIEVTPEWLSEAVAKLFSQDSIGAVQCKSIFHGTKDIIDSIGLSIDRCNVALIIGRNEEDTGKYDNLPEIGAFSGGAMLIRKKLFEQLGGFDETYFMYFEDVDLSWRLKMAGYKITPAPTSLVYHVGSASSGIVTKTRVWDPSPFFAFEMTKNYLYCWFKNSKRKTVICYFPVVSGIVISMCLLALIRRKPKIFMAHMKAVIWIMRNSRTICKRGTEIQKLKNGTSDDLLFIKQISKGSTNLTNGLRKMLSMMRNAI
jgi:GT2 family glycosyltransferase